MTECIGFPAIASANARVLILGSLPGAESLARHEYYAKKQNCFWRVMGELIGFDPQAAYPERLKELKAKKITLWDVCASARRVGSLDSRIEMPTVVPNKIDLFLTQHRHIELICFNGQAAHRLFTRMVEPHLTKRHAGLRREILPSTSPAHAGMTYQNKAKAWRDILAGYIS